ncbi:DUF500 domain protein [Metarhizium album ARSEF 1941]|uniref:DUF500 domain protein n=1 Tax=Metarhizium album (strain ARSEF 1941) TaxID=1081103 RepID=A0A0B2WPW6_METAS|nr:DUF500 domain protein [Metarhizium album ARSEF 1941]KHN95527.1 DUF500 domain protein [Metarhizium album ARSEF 1941]
MSSNEKAGDEGVAELSGNTGAAASGTYFPGPPPGPPPAQSQTQLSQPPPSPQGQPEQQPPAQHQPPPPQQPERQQQHQQHQQHQPPYFPPPPPAPDDEKQSHQQQQHGANPVFAPPPTGQHDAPTSSPQAQQQQQQQQQQSQQSQAGHKKPGWGHRFKHLVSAGAAAPINSLAHKLGSQSFLPETLDKECDKAAAILRSFCAKGVYADPGAGRPPTSTAPKAQESGSAVADPAREKKPKNRVIVTIPPKVISKAVGLAIFTTLRAGFQISGATGSGVLIARLPDGSWSPPSGIQVHSVGGGFQIGLDIYDCVCVINSRQALAAFTNTRVSLGSDLAVVAGPYGAGAAVDFGTAVQRSGGETDKKGTASGSASGPVQAPTAAAAAAAQGQHSNALPPDAGASGDSKRRSLSAGTFKPVFSYVKSRGFYAGIQVDGTVVVERKDANAAFYGCPITVQQILQGQVPPEGPQNMWPVGARGLLETLRGAEAGAQSSAAPVSPALGMTASPGTGNAPSSNETPAAAAAGGQAPSGAPPAYADDGSHAQDGDVKYA